MACGSPASKAFIEMSRRISFSLNTSTAALMRSSVDDVMIDGLLALPGDGGVGAAEVEPGGQLLGSLVQRVVDLLAIDLADDVER